MYHTLWTPRTRRPCARPSVFTTHAQRSNVVVRYGRFLGFFGLPNEKKKQRIGEAASQSPLSPSAPLVGTAAHLSSAVLPILLSCFVLFLFYYYLRRLGLGVCSAALMRACEGRGRSRSHGASHVQKEEEARCMKRKEQHKAAITRGGKPHRHTLKHHNPTTS